MALNFPNSPTNGQVYTDTPSGNRWVWDSANTVWKSTSTFTQTITVASSAPGSPVIGQLWWNQDYGRLLVYYNDGTSSQWVDASPSDYTSQLAYGQANASYTVANSAFGKANNALANTSGVSFAGDLYIPTNLGIGTNGPSNKLDVYQAASTPTAPVRVLYNAPSVTYANTHVVVQNMNGANGDKALYGAGLQATGGNGYNPVGFGAVQTDYLNRYAAMVFYVSSSDNFSIASHERMRIDNNGNIGVGVTPSSWGTTSKAIEMGYAGSAFFTNTTGYTDICSGLYYNVNWKYSNSTTKAALIELGACTINTYTVTTVGTAGATATLATGPYVGNGGTSWTSSSDGRLKDIIEPIENGIQKVNTLRAVIGKFKTDEADKRRVFLIAQDVQAVLPEAVDDTNPDSLGLNYQDIIPLLTAAIQELSAKLDEANARIAKLEGN